MIGEDDNDFQQFKELDLQLAKALQIDVPLLVMPELPEIEAAEVALLPVRQGPMKAVWFAIAASLVLAISISVRMSGVFDTPDSLAVQVLAHIDHEPGSLRVTDVVVPENQLARAVPASLATYERGEALITYAQPCVINGKLTPHLVIQGQQGPVTIILMPDEHIAVATSIDGVNVKGVILPVGNGSIAIVGGRDEPLELIKKNVVSSVTWTT